LASNYWNRIWILQELALSPSVIFVGDDELLLTDELSAVITWAPGHSFIPVVKPDYASDDLWVALTLKAPEWARVLLQDLASEFLDWP
jgi:hypothetical protein